MLPALTPGSLVLVQPLTGGLLSIGEIVLCNLAGRLIAHRIVGTCTDQTGKRMLLTRGDNQSACDLPVDFGSVLGRVSALEGAWRGGLRQIGAALARLVEGRGTGA